MRQRLSGAMPYQVLDNFASILEPITAYQRHAGKYQTNTPLNRLVDSLGPESAAAREFRNAVDEYLATPYEQRNSEDLRRHLAEWAASARAVRPVFETNSLLTENLPVADSVVTLCQVGTEALLALDPASQSTNARDASWKQRSAAAVQDAGTRKGDILLPIAPGVAKLVDAVVVAPVQ